MGNFRLKRLLELEDGWLFGEGTSYKEEQINLLIDKLTNLYDDDLPTPIAFPMENGDVQLTWLSDDFDITLDINLDTFNSSLHDLNFKTKDEVTNELDLNEIEGWEFINGYIRNVFDV